MRTSLALVLSLALALLVSGCAKSDSPSGTAPTANDLADKNGDGTLDGSEVNPDENKNLPAAPGGMKLETLKSVKLVVNNKATINNMIDSGANVWIHGGKVLGSIEEVKGNEAFCSLYAHWGAPAYKAGDTFVFTLIGWKEKTAHFHTSDSKLALYCAKVGEDTAWSHLDIVNAFGGFATITPVSK